MEIIVQGTEGIPSSSILSIRAGTTRRQAPLSSVELEKPFKFPYKPEDCTHVKIDLFQHVGTARTVSQAGTNDHKLILEPVKAAGKGVFGDNMEVCFQIRGASKDSKNNAVGSIDIGRKQKAEAAMDHYLDQHNLTAFFQSILQGLIKEQPDNPYSFVARQFILQAHEMQYPNNAMAAPAPDPSSLLRQQVVDCLVTANESGELERMLSKSQERAEGQPKNADEAAGDVSVLKDAVSQLEQQLQQLLAENADLKSIVTDIDKGKKPESKVENPAKEMDVLRLRAKDIFISASKDGKLTETLQEVITPQEADKVAEPLPQRRDSKNKRRATWMQGDNAPQDFKFEPPPPTLRTKVRGSLLAGLQDGRLETALKAAPKAPITNRSMPPEGEILLLDGTMLVVGAEARLSDGSMGRVQSRTTTDVILRLADGTDASFGIEDLFEQGVMLTSTGLNEGETAVRLSDKAKGSVKTRLTTEVLVVMPDGSEVWHAIEDLARALPEAFCLQVGDEAVRVEDSAVGVVISRTTTDVTLKLDDGTEVSQCVTELARTNRTRSQEKLESAVLKSMVVNMLADGAETGAFLDAITEASKTPVVGQRGFTEYYEKYMVQSLDGDAWNAIHTRFPAAEKVVQQEVPMKPKEVRGPYHRQPSVGAWLQKSPFLVQGAAGTSPDKEEAPTQPQAAQSSGTFQSMDSAAWSAIYSKFPPAEKQKSTQAPQAPKFPFMDAAAWSAIYSKFPPAEKAAPAQAPKALVRAPTPLECSTNIQSMGPAAWDGIHSQFPSAVKEQVPEVQVRVPEASAVDLNHVQALHSELEQLAQDRAALLRQVDEIRRLMNTVTVENQQLAGQVLSRPISAETRRKYSDEKQSDLSKYGL